MNKILILDDEPDIVDILMAFLGDVFKVYPSYLFDQAQTILESENIDLILSDLTMPGISSEDLVREFQSLSPQSLIVIMSGYSKDSPQIKQCLNSGARASIEKPFHDPGEIIEMLQGLFHQGEGKKAG